MQKTLKVLLIEDDLSDVELLRYSLAHSSSGQIEIELCQRLAEALKRLGDENADFDVILLDLQLPDSKGMETFASVHQKAPQIPIVILSGLNDETLAIQAVQKGAQDYLVKDQVNGDLLMRALRYSVERNRAEETLRESEKLYRSLFENMLKGFAYCKMLFGQDQPQDFVFLSVNHSFEVLTGLQNVVGKRVSEVIPGLRESDPEIFEIYSRVALTGNSERFETYVTALEMWFSVSVYSPEKEYFVTVFDVITERKRAEEALLRSEKEYRLLVSQIPAMVFKRYGDWSIDPLDEKVEALTGYSKEDFEARRVKWCDLIPAEDLDYATRVFTEALKADKSYVREHCLRKKDGEIIWVQCRGQIFLNDQGKVDHISGVSFDVTQRKRAEETLRERMKELTCLYAVSREIQEDLSIDELCRRVVDHLVPAMQFPEITVPVIELRGKRFSSDNYTDGLSHGLQAEIRVKDEALGHLRVYYAEERPFLIPEEQNLVTGVAEALSTWLERKQAEQERSDNETQHRAILQTAMDGFWMVDTQGRLLEVNETYCRMSGYSAPELLAMCIPDLDDRETAGDTAAHNQKIMAQGEDRFESQHRRKDGSIFDIEVSVQHQPIGGGRMVAFLRDITERKRAEEALLESERKYRLLAENVIDVIWTMDLNWKLTFASPSCESLSGYKDKEIVGMTLDQLLTPDSMDLCKKTIAEILYPENLGRQEYPHFILPQLALRFKDGSRSVYIEVKGSFLTDAQGQPCGMVGVSRDITARKQLEEQVLQAQKMEAVGTLAGGIAHDFNNILTAILGNIGLAALDDKIGPRVKDRLAQAEAACLRAEALSQQLLTFAKGGAPVKRLFSVAELLIESTAFTCVGSAVKCETTFPANLWWIEADPGQIGQIFQNITINAIQAMSGFVTLVGVF